MCWWDLGDKNKDNEEFGKEEEEGEAWGEEESSYEGEDEEVVRDDVPVYNVPKVA